MKERIDVLLKEKGFFESREKAKQAVLSGWVQCDGVLINKPGTKISSDTEIKLTNTHKYVSRGGLKLEGVIKSFDLDIDNDIFIDIGASTGGFTECLLNNGAKMVWAVDVGTGQLHKSLIDDPRVVVMDGVNCRYIEPSMFPQKFDAAVIDVSFISLKLILPAAQSVIKDDGYIISLVKPQFEAGRDKIKKSGIIKDKKLHKHILFDIIKFASEINLNIAGVDISLVRGGDGNTEFLLYLKKNTVVNDFNIDVIDEIIDRR